MKTHVDFLDPVALTTGNLPLDSLLDNSVYYPASGYDVDLIRLFNKILTEKGVRSFVYCDYESTEEKVISKAGLHMRGYHVLAHRAVDVSELLGPVLILDTSFLSEDARRQSDVTVSSAIGSSSKEIVHLLKVTVRRGSLSCTSALKVSRHMNLYIIQEE